MIGPDVTHDQHQTVQELIKEYADCFALSMKEVNTIPGAIHKLNILEGANFQTKIPPMLYNPDQHAFIDSRVDKMLEAKIIWPIHPSEVQFIAQTVLAKKVHDGQELDMTSLNIRSINNALNMDYQTNSKCPLPRTKTEPPNHE